MREPTETVIGEINGHDVYAAGYFEEGYPEKMYLKNGDPGYPGEPDQMVDIAVYVYHKGMQKDLDGNETFAKDEDGNYIKENQKVFLDEYVKFFWEEAEESLFKHLERFGR